MKKKNILCMCIAILCAFVISYVSYYIFNSLIQYRAEENDYLENIQHVAIANKQEEKSLAKELESIDFEGLLDINDECVGWVVIPDTLISYPIVQGENNQYYTEHTFKNIRSKVGAIFMNYKNLANFSDKNTIIYGHNLMNGKMFSDLRKFLSEDFFNKHKRVFIYTADGEKIEYEVFSAYKTMTGDRTYTRNFSDYNDFKTHMEYLSKSSSVKTAFFEYSSIVTLSTCSNNAKGERIVVIVGKI